MSKPIRVIPEGHHGVTPYLTCKNAAKAIDFCKSVFGATEIMPMGSPDGKIGHAELKIGDSHIFVSDEFPGMNSAPAPGVKSSCGVFLYTENVDTTFKAAVGAGAEVDMPLENQFWGDRHGKLTDPFGHQWALAQHVEDVAPAEMERRSREWQAKMAKAAAAGQSKPFVASTSNHRPRTSEIRRAWLVCLGCIAASLSMFLPPTLEICMNWAGLGNIS